MPDTCVPYTALLQAIPPESVLAYTVKISLSKTCRRCRVTTRVVPSSLVAKSIFLHDEGEAPYSRPDISVTEDSRQAAFNVAYVSRACAVIT